MEEKTSTISDWEKLVFRNSFVRKKLKNGSFQHDEDCPCSRAKDESSAWVDWHDIKGGHFTFCVDKLDAKIYRYIEIEQIEQIKMDLYDSLISNLTHALPMNDHA